MCKWLKILSKSVSQHPVDHFKLFRSILALKLTELQAFEISNIFGSLSFGRRLKNIEEILSNGYRTAHFSFENFKKVIFWPKSLVFKILKKKKVIFGLKSSIKYCCDNLKWFYEIKRVTFGLDSSFKYCCDNLKWLLMKAFKHLNQIKQAGHVHNAGHVSNTHALQDRQHDLHLDHEDENQHSNSRLHVGLNNGVFHCNKSGEINPIKIRIKSISML